jgi:hypothetical protein
MMMVRTRVSLLAALLLLVVGVGPAGARQEATPESALAGLGLPELAITVTGSAFEGIPEQLAAGRYLVTLTAAEDAAEGGAVAFVQPSGMTAEEFLGALAGPPEETGGDPAGTPLAVPEATPADAEEGDDIPPFLFEATFAGGTYAPPGQTVQIVLDLPPGEWIAWGDEPEAPQAPVVFEATGEMPADLPEPAADATVVMGEYVIQVSEGALAAGQQVVKVENIGAQPHFILWTKGPDDMTQEQIAAILEAEMQAEMTGTPPADLPFNPDEDLQDFFYTATQSTGASVWIPLDLEPGAYLLICFFPDLADGIPHAFKGMYTVVQVAA